MNFPGQDKEDLATIKRLLKEYRTLRTRQLYAWFPDKERRVVGNMLTFSNGADSSSLMKPANMPHSTSQNLKRAGMTGGSPPSGCCSALQVGSNITPAESIRRRSFSSAAAENTKSYMCPMGTKR